MIRNTGSCTVIQAGCQAGGYTKKGFISSGKKVRILLQVMARTDSSCSQEETWSRLRNLILKQLITQKSFFLQRHRHGYGCWGSCSCGRSTFFCLTRKYLSCLTTSMSRRPSRAFFSTIARLSSRETALR